jgi:hypothetical protein
MERIKTDLVMLEEEMRDKRKFSRQSRLRKVIKKVLTELGYWKHKARGNPKKGWRVRIENEQRQTRETPTESVKRNEN